MSSFEPPPSLSWSATRSFDPMAIDDSHSYNNINQPSALSRDAVRPLVCSQTTSSGGYKDSFGQPPSLVRGPQASQTASPDHVCDVEPLASDHFMIWTPEQLHKRFVDAVTRLGIEKADPETVLRLINVEGLRQEDVATHLQKYKLYLDRLMQEKRRNHRRVKKAPRQLITSASGSVASSS